MYGEWNIDVKVGTLPEKVATAFGKLAELVGCEYSPIAYLGSQLVNGINHAVLAEQTVLSGKDTKNIVLIIFNEKPNDIDLTLVSIERILEGGAEYGGFTVDVQTDEFPKAAQLAFDKAMEDFVGSKIENFAYLGSQIVNGEDFVFAAVETSFYRNEQDLSVVLVTVNSIEGIEVDDILN